MSSGTAFPVAAVILAMAVVAGFGCAPDHADTHPRDWIGPHGAVDMDFFYDELAPFGRWIDDPTFGWAWTPYGVDPFWRPYSRGRWAWSDQGWLWLSDEPWGWATAHYGRWFDDPVYGWMWVPDTVWAPAWVDWHAGGDWVGWAPLPPAGPARRYEPVERPSAESWTFVPRGRMLSTKLHEHAAPLPRNGSLLERTRRVGGVAERGGRVITSGPNPEAVAREISRRRLVDGRSPGRPGDVLERRTVRVFRPRIDGDPRRTAPPAEYRNGVETPVERIREIRRRNEVRLERESAIERERLRRLHQEEIRRNGEAERARREDEAAMRRRQAEERRRLEDYERRQKRIIEKRSERKIVPPEKKREQKSDRRRNLRDRRRDGS